MTDKIAEIAVIEAKLLSPLERKKILRAKRDGANYLMRRGDARGLHGRGLVYRTFDGHYLTETGLAVRAYLLENTDA